MTITVDVKSEVKVFSESRMEEVCALYGLGYDPANPLCQFPKFQCKDEHVDDELLSYIMQELNSRTALTPVAKPPEAHNSIYVLMFRPGSGITVLSSRSLRSPEGLNRAGPVSRIAGIAISAVQGRAKAGHKVSGS